MDCFKLLTMGAYLQKKAVRLMSIRLILGGLKQPDILAAWLSPHAFPIHEPMIFTGIQPTQVTPSFSARYSILETFVGNKSHY